MANPAKAYLSTQVKTTSQGQLLLMLYQAAIKFLKRAVIEIERKDYAKKGIYISKAMAIVHELAESLNKDKGGQITENLGQIYHFCTMQLVKANIKMDTAMIEDVIRILDGIYSAYAQIIPDENELVEAGKMPEKLAAQKAAEEEAAAKLAEAKQQQADNAKGVEESSEAKAEPAPEVPPLLPFKATEEVPKMQPQEPQMQPAPVYPAQVPPVQPAPVPPVAAAPKPAAPKPAAPKPPVAPAPNAAPIPPVQPANPVKPVNPARARAANAYGSLQR